MAEENKDNKNIYFPYYWLDDYSGIVVMSLAPTPPKPLLIWSSIGYYRKTQWVQIEDPTKYEVI